VLSIFYTWTIIVHIGIRAEGEKGKETGIYTELINPRTAFTLGQEDKEFQL
jgi:hypothetical protein